MNECVVCKGPTDRPFCSTCMAAANRQADADETAEGREQADDGLPMFTPPDRLPHRLVVHLLTDEPATPGLIGVSAWSCKACGALVFDLQTHAGWHQDGPATARERTSPSDVGGAPDVDHP